MRHLHHNVEARRAAVFARCCYLWHCVHYKQMRVRTHSTACSVDVTTYGAMTRCAAVTCSRSRSLHPSFFLSLSRSLCLSLLSLGVSLCLSRPHSLHSLSSLALHVSICQENTMIEMRRWKISYLHFEAK